MCFTWREMLSDQKTKAYAVVSVVFSPSPSLRAASDYINVMPVK